MRCLPRSAFRLGLLVATALSVAGCGAAGDLLNHATSTGTSGGSSGGGGGGGTLNVSASMQHTLDAINAYRASVGSPALVLDAQLNSFADVGSQVLQQNHIPHKHFTDAANAGTMFTTDGFRNNAGENQGDPNGWPPASSVDAQIDQILQAMWAEGPGGGHYENMKNPAFTRLGVGLLVDANGRLYFTNDFSG